MNNTINVIANEYKNNCYKNISTADVKSLCIKHEIDTEGYINIDSLKAAVSKKIKKKKFQKKMYLLDLIKSTYEKIENINQYTKNEQIELIQKKLANHHLKYNLVRDYLQELNLGVRKHKKTTKALEKFEGYINKGHSYSYAVNEANLSRHLKKRAKNWFVYCNNGDIRETYNPRRLNKKHTYLNLKDVLLLEKNEEKLSKIWTAIGFIFADGSCQNSSIQIVVTNKDGYYLSDFILPILLDNSIKNNHGPKLIEAHSNQHASSYNGSKPVKRLHLDDSHLSAFFSELGMPTNKIKNKIKLSEKILNLPDKLFFSFLSGLFAGDGCITRCKKEHLHVDFDLHKKYFCSILANQIYKRSGVPMDVQSYKTKKGIDHFRLVATTNWRAISVLSLLLFYAPYQLKRKIVTANKYFSDLESSVGAYATSLLKPSDLANNKISEIEFLNYLELLKIYARKNEGFIIHDHI